MNKSAIGFAFILLALALGIVLNQPLATGIAWESDLTGEVTIPPVAGNNEVFVPVGIEEVQKLDDKGKSVARARVRLTPKSSLILLDSFLLVSEDSRKFSVHSRKDLKMIWEKEVPGPSFMPPIGLGGDLILLQTGVDQFTCFRAADGEILWKSTMRGEIARVSHGKSLACICSIPDPQQKILTLEGVDSQNGQFLWRFSGYVTDQPPIVVGDFFVFCDQAGRPIVVDQMTGEEKFRHEKDGLKIAGIFENDLMFYAAGGSRIESLALGTGKSWSSTLQAPLARCLGKDGLIFFIDGKSLKCVSAETGMSRWQKELEGAQDAFMTSDGVCVSGAEGLIATGWYVSCFRPQTGQILWTVADVTPFWEPISFQNGDFVIARSGKLFFMPRSRESSIGASPAVATAGYFFCPRIPLNGGPTNRGQGGSGSRDLQGSGTLDSLDGKSQERGR